MRETTIRVRDAGLIKDWISRFADMTDRLKRLSNSFGKLGITEIHLDPDSGFSITFYTDSLEIAQAIQSSVAASYGAIQGEPAQADG